jgi:hypothetical protein
MRPLSEIPAAIMLFAYQGRALKSTYSSGEKQIDDHVKGLRAI